MPVPAVDLADRANDPIARQDAIGMLAPTLLEQGVADRFDDALDEAASVAVDIREPLLRSMTLLTQCCMTIVRGDLPLAEHQAANLIDYGFDSVDAQEGYTEVTGIIRWHQGRLSDALPEIRAALARTPRLTTRRAELALAEAISGDPEKAKNLLRDAADNNFDLPYGPAWLGGLCRWAAVAAEVGDPDAAAILYGKLSPWSALFGTIGPMPVHRVSHSLGRLAEQLGNIHTADQHFALAWQTHQTMHAPFYTAETALYWGQMLIQSEPDRARHLLTHALELASRYRFGDVERRSRKLNGCPCRRAHSATTSATIRPS